MSSPRNSASGHTAFLTPTQEEIDSSESESDVIEIKMPPLFRKIRRVRVQRQVATQDHVINQFGRLLYKKRTLGSRIRALTSCSTDKVCSFFIILFPIFYFCKTYDFRKFLFGDLLGGLSVACLHFPQGLAYGILANLTPAHGLYSSLFPVLLYMVFGTSPHVSMGTNAIVALMIQEMLEMDPIYSNMPKPDVFNSSAQNYSSDTFAIEAAALEYRDRITAASTLMVGVIMVLMSVFRLGFVTSYLSQSFISGFTTAAGVHIFTSQVSKALGITIPIHTGVGKIVYTYIDIFKQVSASNIGSIVVTLVCVLILFIVKECINEKFKDKMKMPVPIDLVIIVLATLVSHFAKFEQEFGVKVIGEVPRGIPPPAIPLFEPFGLIFVESFKIAILTCFLNLSMAKLCAKLNGYEIEENAELMAYGMSNLGSAFFHCFPASVAPPRTMLLSILGAKTTLNAIFTTIVLFLILYAIGPLFASLPLPVLAAMIMVAMKRLLVQVTEVHRYWKISRYDSAIWIVSCISAVILDLPYGLMCGIFISLFTVIAQSQKSQIFLLGKSTSEDLYLSMEHHDCTKEIPGIKIIRMESSLYFATAENFRKRVYRVLWNPDRLNRDVRINSLNYIRRMSTLEFRRMSRIPTGLELEILPMNKETKSHPGEFFRITPSEDSTVTSSATQFLVIDCLPITYLDMNGVDILTTVVKDLQRVKMTLFLARCSSYMLRVLEKSGIYDIMPRTDVFADLADAVVEAEMRMSSNK